MQLDADIMVQKLRKESQQILIYQSNKKDNLILSGNYMIWALNNENRKNFTFIMQDVLNYRLSRRYLGSTQLWFCLPHYNICYCAGHDLTSEYP